VYRSLRRKKALRQEANKDSEVKIQFDFTSPYTPQQNGKIEQKFATLWLKARAQLNSAQLTCSEFWTQCANLSPQLGKIFITKDLKDTPYEEMHN
jgi:transposase InsO family protein